MPQLAYDPKLSFFDSILSGRPIINNDFVSNLPEAKTICSARWKTVYFSCTKSNKVKLFAAIVRIFLVRLNII